MEQHIRANAAANSHAHAADTFHKESLNLYQSKCESDWVHSHSKRIFTHIRKVSGRAPCTQRAIHKKCMLPKARMFASVLHIQLFRAYPHVHARSTCAHAHMDALRIFAQKRHYGGSAHFHAEASAQTADFPSLLEQRNDLVKFALQTAQIPILLEQQNNLADFRTRRNTRKKPSQLKQQKYLAHFSKREAHQTPHC
jgi:hypothetical protein